MGMRLRSRDNMTPAIAFLLYGLLLGSVDSLEEKPVLPIEKIGQCPNEVDYPKCNVDIKPERLCKSDANCKGAAKCCLYECKFQCVEPLGDKELSCPYFDTKQCMYIRPSPDQCQHDDQCTGTERCCCYYCSRQCKKTVKVKPGECPALKKPCSEYLSKPQCKEDSDCPKEKKCCDQCGKQCIKPVSVRPGFCPYVKDDLSCGNIWDTTECSTDINCKAPLKCCRIENKMQCTKPLKEKPGMCPVVNTLVACKNNPPPLCRDDKQCTGIKKCCLYGCQVMCVEPWFMKE